MRGNTLSILHIYLWYFGTLVHIVCYQELTNPHFGTLAYIPPDTTKLHDLTQLGTCVIL